MRTASSPGCGSLQVKFAVPLTHHGSAAVALARVCNLTVAIPALRTDHGGVDTARVTGAAYTISNCGDFCLLQKSWCTTTRLKRPPPCDKAIHLLDVNVTFLGDAYGADTWSLWGTLLKLDECKIIAHTLRAVAWVFNDSTHGHTRLVVPYIVLVMITQHYLK